MAVIPVRPGGEGGVTRNRRTDRYALRYVSCTTSAASSFVPRTARQRPRPRRSHPHQLLERQRSPRRPPPQGDHHRSDAHERKGSRQPADGTGGRGGERARARTRGREGGDERARAGALRGTGGAGAPRPRTRRERYTQCGRDARGAERQRGARAERRVPAPRVRRPRRRACRASVKTPTTGKHAGGRWKRHGDRLEQSPDSRERPSG